MVKIKTDKNGRANIYCVTCGVKLFTHDGKTTIYKEVKCKTCNKLTRYYPDRKFVESREVPERTTSSGCRFY